MQTTAQLARYADAGYPCVAVSTSDEDRAIQAISALRPTAPCLRIAAVGGLLDARNGAVLDKAANFQSAFNRASQTTDAVLIVLDFQHVIRNAGSYRSLRDSLNAVKEHGAMIVLVAPGWHLPAELEHDIPVLDDALPTRGELNSSLDTIVEAIASATNSEIGSVTPDDDTRQAILDAASGLTLAEAEGAMALASPDGRFDVGVVEDQKMKLVRQSGYLEVSPVAQLSDLGGLQGVRDYFDTEVIPSAHDPQLAVRGLLMVGVPGTGKSLLAKVAGSLLRWPVIRCNLSNLKAGIVGETERQTRAALRLVEAISPCVFFMDEAEKSLGGYASSAHTDSGVTLGMVGTLLTWMQEHTKPILTIMTVNDFTKLPAELTRAGRMDEKFFVDLPTAAERIDIARVHLAKFGADEALAGNIADLTTDWTGAEIEQLIRSTARRTKRQVTFDALAMCALDIRPIARVKADEIKALRGWGNDNLRRANSPETVATGARKMRVTKAA